METKYPNVTKLYRFQDHGNQVQLLTIQPIKETEKGWWIERVREDGSKPNLEGRLYVSKLDNDKLKYAYATKKSAFEGYKKQKLGIIFTCESKIERAFKQINVAENLLKHPK